ncbi:Flagellar biosynthetic protein fliU [uncultured Clostridium sp.]|uniref:flagellin lysine-N-methylase n=1 Tax=uncultured Clostridium sp. TaxID=59620 RepID=UPI000823027C|nr:flagellin lysine-N-methylase [uncultured Clostridium sp.]SCJ04203.1 Flagellar biosynthetic protein fliU [uncultured Clostridium sp.]
MNKEINISKISYYDKFKCIADKCKFTCCEGWDVAIDSDTYSRWKKIDDNNLLSNVKVNKCGGKKEYLINKKTSERCLFLDDKGLCNIVKERGEEYLSLTCSTFPRIENIFEDLKEISLSCACPEVVEIISNMDSGIEMYNEGFDNSYEYLLELKIRENIVNIINIENLELDKKLILSFQMLLNILYNEEITEDLLLNEFESFKDTKYLKELIDMYDEIEVNKYDAIEEVNNLFLDIIENYKDVSGLEILLKDISHYAEEADLDNLVDIWESFEGQFEEYNTLLKNCIIAKVLSSCISDDVEELALSLQMIIIEYLLVRYAVFLNYSIREDNNIKIEDIKDYIVCFSRVIGNNSDSVIEFLEGGFGNPILEIGYLCFISLF